MVQGPVDSQSWGQFWQLLPIAVGASALACALFERARARVRGGSDEEIVGVPVVALGAAVALVLYPLSLAADVETRALVIAAALGGALWLAGRAEQDPRLEPVFLAAAGIVAGARTHLGLALSPLLLMALYRTARSSRGGRAVAGNVIVFCAGHAAGLLALGRHAAPLALAPGQWWVAAARAVGPAALALAAAGLLLALGSGTRRAPLALCVGGLVAAEVMTGRTGPISSLALALGVGLLIVECGARLAARALRGAELALIPIALLALAEPLAVRLRTAHLPTFGPVPPSAPARDKR